MKFCPHHDRVVIQATKPNQTAGGLFLPDRVQQPPEDGFVVAVGPGRYNEQGGQVPMQAEVGQHVLFSRWGHHSIKVDDVEYFVISDSEVLGHLPKAVAVERVDPEPASA